MNNPLSNLKKKNKSIGGSVKNKEINNSNLFFNRTFKDRQEYNKVKIENSESEYDCWIYSNSSYKKLLSQKTIIFAPNCKDVKIESGNYITPIDSNEIYLLDGFDDQYPTKKKGLLVECKNNLKFINDDGEKSFPCYISDRISGIFEEERVLPLPTNTIEIKTQQNDFTYNIPLNYRFLFGTQAFRVVSKNDYINQSDNFGVITFRMEKDQKSEYDDFGNQIAYNGDNYKIETNIDGIENIVGYSSNIVAKVYKNNVEINNLAIQYESNNEEIISIDNSGNFELLSNGSTEIGVIFGNEKVIIPVIVDLVIVEDVKFNLNPNLTKITKFENEKSIEIEKFVNGEKTIESLNISYNVAGRDSDSAYEINVTDNTIIINNISARNSKISITVDDGIGNVGSFEILLTVY